MQVIAYTYEADYHCLGCTAERFDILDREILGSYQGIDSEGNEIHPVFSTDEWYANDIFEGNREAILGCGTCGAVIERKFL